LALDLVLSREKLAFKLFAERRREFADMELSAALQAGSGMEQISLA